MTLRDTIKNMTTPVEFLTMRPPNSKLTTLDRRLIVTGPPALAEASRSGDPALLEELIALLQDQATAWNAAVLLAAMTRREEKTLEVFAAEPSEWWDVWGKTAFERWSKWLEESRGKLVWNSEENMFVEEE